MAGKVVPQLTAETLSMRIKAMTADLGVQNARPSLVNEAAYYFRPAPSTPNSEFVFRASSHRKIQWDLVLILFVIYDSLSIPFLTAFDTSNSLQPLEVLEYVIDCCFGLDIILSFRTSYIDKNGDEIVDPKQIFRYYGYSYKFPLDVVSVIPLETILVSTIQFYLLQGKANNMTLKLLSLIKLKRMVRLRRIITMLRFKMAFKLWIRILFVVFTLFLFVHFAAAFWFMLVSSDGNWVAPKDIDKEVDLYSSSVWVQYTTSLYYATMLMLGVDAMPSTTGETIYACIIVYLGAIITAALFGQMTVLVQNLNSKQTQYHEALDSVNQAMDNIKAPKDLQRKVVNYIMHTYWHRDQQEELQKFFETLSPSLKFEVCTQLYKEVLLLNPRIASSSGCVDFLVRKLNAKLCKPEDVLIYYEEVGTEMYILAQGEVSVLCPDKYGTEQHMRYLNSGDYFGEVSLLTGARRTATVLANNFCTFAELGKPSFDEVMETYPVLKSRMAIYASETYTEEWKTEAIKILAQLPYFSGCTDLELSQIYYALKTERYDAECKLAGRNDPIDRLFLVATGKVTVSMVLKSGEEIKVLILKPGSAGFICSAVLEKKQQFIVKISPESCLLFLTSADLSSNFHIRIRGFLPNCEKRIGNLLKKGRRRQTSVRRLLCSSVSPT